ncbi:MAG: pilus assembly protein TadG-related protein, partial [Psychromonas sp.]
MGDFKVVNKINSFNKQQGNILVMFTIGLFALIAMAALALDGGHLLLNKSRLQNIADTAALHAAKTLDEGKSQAEAEDAVFEMINLNLGSSSDSDWNSAYPNRDNFEIKEALDLDVNVTVEFLLYPDPDNPPEILPDEARYVKVEIRNLGLNNFLADIMSFNKRISATALAGPSTAIVACPNDVVPMMVCGDFSEDAPVDDDHAYGLPL